MIKAAFNLFILVLLSYAAAGQSGPVQNNKARVALSLNGKWNHIVDPYENGFYDYRRKAFDASASGKGGFFDDITNTDKSELIEYNFDYSPALNVPGDWNSQVEKLELYEGTVWYRKMFNMSPDKGKKYFLYFAAANYEAHVYLNGKKLGAHKGGFTPFQFQIDKHLISGENSVVVKVDNTRKQDEIPTINTDWWNYGGITRDVFITETPQSYIADYKIQLSAADRGTIEGYIQLAGNTQTENVRVQIPELGISLQAKTDASGKAHIRIPARKISYWSPENPKLYAVTIRSAADQLEDRIGFKTIETKGQDILLNGKSVFLRGISIHDENPLLAGRLRSQGDMRMMLQWAKELGCNYVRLAHYPHSEDMVRLADEMGLMVWAEVPVYWTISWDNPDTYNNAKQQLTDLISRDKNRSSVIIWSVGNETPLSEQRHTFMGNLISHARSLDNTRLIAAALEVHRNGTEVIVDDPLGEKIDLVSFNEYAGWYWGGTPDEIGKYHFNIKYSKPVVVSEFGADALGGFYADDKTKFSEEYQEALYESQIALLSTIKGLRGMTPWILADFRSPRRQHPVYQNFWNRKGLISETGSKKKAFYTLKSFYSKKQEQYK